MFVQLNDLNKSRIDINLVSSMFDFNGTGTAHYLQVDYVFGKTKWYDYGEDNIDICRNDQKKIHELWNDDSDTIKL